MEKKILPALLLFLGLTGCKNHVVPTPESRAEQALSSPAESVQPPTPHPDTPAPLYTIQPSSSVQPSPPSRPYFSPIPRKKAPLEELSVALIPLAMYELTGRSQYENGVFIKERTPVATMLEYGVRAEALTAQRYLVPGKDLELIIHLAEALATAGYFGNQVFHLTRAEQERIAQGYANRILTKEERIEISKKASEARNKVVAPIHQFFTKRYRA